VIFLGKVALIGLSAFLLKRRRKGFKIRVGKVTLETKKGRIVANDVELEMDKENSSEEDVAKALSEKLNDLLDEYLK
jgi:NACalpha-BTF3-like transcription factor